MTAPEVVAGPQPLDDDSPGGLAARLASTGIGDRVYRVVITVFAACVPLLLAAIAIEIGVAAWPALHEFGFDFLVSSDWDPVNGSFDDHDSQLVVLAFANNSRTVGNAATEIVKYYLQLHYGIQKDYRLPELLKRGNFYGD